MFYGIGHHCQKWKLLILGVDELCFVTFFHFNFFSVRGTKTFFAFRRENSPVQPLAMAIEGEAAGGKDGNGSFWLVVVFFVAPFS